MNPPPFALGIAIAFLAVGNRCAEAIELPAAQPERGTIHRWVTLPATFAPCQQVDLRARVSGYVKSIAVDRGDVVQSGQPLLEIEVPELQADLIHHQAEATAAEIAAKRLREALTKSPDLVLPQDLDDAEARLALASADLARAQALLDFAQLKAPFAATVTERLVHPGAFAAAGGEPLLRLADASILRLRIPMVEMEAARIAVGQPVEAKVDALGGESVTASVSRISGSLDPSTRTLMIEADVKNSKSRLRPGMFASARTGVERHDGAILIPVAGLVKEKANSFVFKHMNGKATKIPVKPGFNDGSRVEIPNLQLDDVILLPGSIPLVDGQEVTVRRP